ncbi:phage protein [Enterobacter asburiae]|uniref:phage protein n=1 Tax=Enterobacter asburiae TaxID=61645 RepID=UPI0022CE0369|nr:phage protein [Enterobacter asburiae]
MTIGADGEVMHSLHADKSGTVTVNLLKTSPTNKKAVAGVQRAESVLRYPGNNVIVIRNKVSGDIITARSVAFQKQPDNANAKAGNTMPGCLTAAKSGSRRVLTDGMLNQRPRLPRGKTQRF